MKICMIVEGAYPYISGGVSSWVHTLISDMPEHEFAIYAIGAEGRKRGKFKYRLPGNVTGVQEVFLDAYLREKGRWGKQYRLTEKEREAMIQLFGGEERVDWDTLFRLLHGGRFKTAADFLMSKDFFNIVQELCLRHYPQVPFTEMFWTLRSMLLPLLEIMRHPLPEADLYHCTSTGYSGVIGSLGKNLYGKPLIVTEHGIYSREREEEIIKAEWVKGYFKDVWIHYFYELSRCAYQHADRVITLFGRNRDIQIELGCPPERTEIVPNGVKTERFASLPGKPPGDDRINIGAFLRVVPIKDIKTMLHAFAVVKEQVPNASLYIMGPAEENEEYLAECKQLAETLQLADVEFTGEVNVVDYMGKMDILMLTSISEGQPLVVLEGMAAGKPFVATDVGGCRELLYGNGDDFGQAGFVAPVMHYESIGRAVIELCRRRELRIKMGQAGRRRVNAHYRHEQFIASYRRIYESFRK